MSDGDALWLSEAEVTRAINLGEAVEALERGLVLEAKGAAGNMAKTHVEWGGGDTLHAIGATFAGEAVVGTKTWAHTAGGATPLLILWDSDSGALRAVIEAFALGQMRTAAMSGVATKWLAHPEAQELAIIGTGKQALGQVAAVAAVRPIRRVKVFGRDAERRAAFIARLAAEGLVAKAAGSVAEAVDGAQVITLVTRATEPFLHAAMIAPGSHINAIGAIVPSRQEFAQDIFPRCAVVAADSPSTARRLSREFREWYGGPKADWSEVAPISAVVAARKARPAGADLTLFKAMGMGVSDLSVGIEVLKRAAASGLGRAIPRPERAKVRWHA